MGSRYRLQENMELQARRAQRDFERQEDWTVRTKYYKHWEKQNNRFDNWTSDNYYQHSTVQYDEKKKKKEKEEALEERRDKLRKLFRNDEVEFGMEVLESPRYKRSPRNEVPTEVLRDINVGLKLAEEERRRHEAELKLYHQWRNDNPIIRNYESNQEKAGLKLAWLDQQIEKRMAQEKTEQETIKLIQDRERLIQKERQLEKFEIEQEARKERLLMEQIEQNMKAFKLNENKKEELIREHIYTQEKQNDFEDILDRRQKDLERRKNKELEFFNINQSKIKLRRKALEIEEELRNERHLIEDIERLKIAEALVNQEEKYKTKEAIKAYLQYVKDQQKLEDQRKQYISFIFDSEAKLMWQKQCRIWQQEQESRDKLLNNVLAGLKKQIEDKVERNRFQRDMIEREKEETLQRVEEFDRQIKEEKDLLERKKYERRMELDKQINEKKLVEMHEDLREQERKKRDLENVKKEEERLRNELMQMQRGKYHPARYQRTRTFW